MIEVVSITPTPGSSITRDQQIVVHLRSSSPFAQVTIGFTSGGNLELAYLQDPAGPTYLAFQAPFVTSTGTPVTDAGWYHYAFTMTRSPMWQSSPTLKVWALNSASEVFMYSQSWELPDSPTSPAVLNVVAGSQVPSNAVFFDKQHFLKILEGSYPADYIQSIKNKAGGGYELFQGMAAVGERVSLAISRLLEDGILMFAGGGSFATVQLSLSRSDVSNGAITLLEGSQFLASKSGRKFIATSSVAFGATDTGPFTITARAIAKGYEYNLRGETLTARGETAPGEIDTIWLLVTPEPQIDQNLKVRQIVDATGGTPLSLDGQGEDRGIPRVSGEPDAVYYQRIVDAPDVVSPNAIVQGVNKILYAYGLAGCCFREVGTSLFPGIFWDDDAWDMDGDVLLSDRFKLWLDEAHFRGYFTIGLPSLAVPDYGLVFDGDDTDAFPVVNAFDQSGPNDQFSSYDGSKEMQDALYASIAECVLQKKLFGVKFDLYLETRGCV